MWRFTRRESLKIRGSVLKILTIEIYESFCRKKESRSQKKVLGGDFCCGVVLRRDGAGADKQCGRRECFIPGRLDQRGVLGKLNECHSTGQCHRCRQVGPGTKPDLAGLGRDGLLDQQRSNRRPVARRQRADESSNLARAGCGGGFGSERGPARPGRTCELAIPHQRRAVAGRHHWVWLGARSALRG